MIDDLIDALERDRGPITKDQFQQWKRNPITEQLFQDLTIQLLQLKFEQPPATMDESALYAHRSYASQSFVEELLNWEPELKDEEA
jgi:hypothetical protein